MSEMDNSLPRTRHFTDYEMFSLQERYCGWMHLPIPPWTDAPSGLTAVIVGSAPTVLGHLEEIRSWKTSGRAAVFAVNDAIPLLIENGIVPDAAAIVEIAAFDWVLEKWRDERIAYYISPACEFDTFNFLEGYKAYLCTVMRGAFTFTRTLHIAAALGHRNIEVYGVDCSHEPGGQTHFFGSRDAWEIRPEMTVDEGERSFVTRRYLKDQVDEFEQFHRDCSQVTVAVHGDGLLAAVHNRLSAKAAA